MIHCGSKQSFKFRWRHNRRGHKGNRTKGTLSTAVLTQAYIILDCNLSQPSKWCTQTHTDKESAGQQRWISSERCGSQIDTDKSDRKRCWRFISYLSLLFLVIPEDGKTTASPHPPSTSSPLLQITVIWTIIAFASINVITALQPWMCNGVHRLQSQVRSIMIDQSQI